MKVCPECQARFAGNEIFCPNDATRLVDARQLAPAALSQTDLNPQIHLERLEFSDRLGERYRGYLRADQTPLRVTVCNQGFTPDPQRLMVLAERRAQLGELLPAEILGLHSLDLKSDTVFIAEQAPQGPSLQTILNERKALTWQNAIRLTCNVGRVLEYLADRGLVLLGLGAHAIFITDLKQGQVQLGEWAHSLLAHPARPLELDADAPDTFLGYPTYLAPEAIRDAGDADQRSLVYSLGNLLYQLITGKAAFTSKSSADVLKRHLHEQPLKLSIAHGGAGLPPELDHLLGLMWQKDPERRFKRLGAAMVALCSLLDEPLDDIAPELTPAENPVFETDALQATLKLSTVDAASPEAQSDEEDESADAPAEPDDTQTKSDDSPPADAAPAASSSTKKEVASETRTMMGMPAIAITSGREATPKEDSAEASAPTEDTSEAQSSGDGAAAASADASAGTDAPPQAASGADEQVASGADEGDAPADSQAADATAATASQADAPDDANDSTQAPDEDAEPAPSTEASTDENEDEEEETHEDDDAPEDSGATSSTPDADADEPAGSIIIDDPELRAAAAAFAADENSEESDESPHKSSGAQASADASNAMFMGTIGDEVQKAADAAKHAREAAAHDDSAKTTSDDAQAKAASDPDADADEDNATQSNARSDRKRKKDKKNKKKDKSRNATPPAEASQASADTQVKSAPDQKSADLKKSKDATEDDKSAAGKVSDTAEKDTAAGDKDKAVEKDNAAVEKDKAAEKNKDNAAESDNGKDGDKPEKGTSKSFEVGFMEVQNDGGGEFAESWFGADATQSWENSQALASHEYAENRHKYITYGLIGGVALLAVIFVVSLQFYNVEPTNAKVAQVDEAAEQEAWKAQAQALRRDFDRAIDDGHLIRPFRDSAINVLEKLKSHAREDAIFTEARDIFVEQAIAAARRNEEENLGYAADLAGYATQMDREDSEVKAYAERLRARLESGHANQPADAPDEEEVPSDAAPEEDTSTTPEEAAPQKPATPPTAASTPPTPPARPEPARPAAADSKPTAPPAPPTRTLATILAEARTARSQNRTEDAARLYREALAQSPGNGTANSGLGDVLFDQAKYAEAVRYYKKASDSAPRNVDYALNLGKTHYKLNQFRDAQQAWQRALAQDPNNAAAQRYMKLIEGKL